MRKMETFSAEAPPLAVSKDEIEQLVVSRLVKATMRDGNSEE